MQNNKELMLKFKSNEIRDKRKSGRKNNYNILITDLILINLVSKSSR